MIVLRLAGRHLGRRGAFLLAMGSGWIMYGVAILTSPAPPAQVQGLSIITAFIPLHCLAWVWIVSGIIGVAFCPARREGSDAPGFTALVMPSAIWATSYLIDWIVVTDYSRGWVVASTYAAISASIVIAAGWPESEAE